LDNADAFAAPIGAHPSSILKGPLFTELHRRRKNPGL